jgi:hypothetical protein
MTRIEKEEYVIRLYKEGRTVREIAEVMHMSFREIAIIKKAKLEVDGAKGRLEEDDDINSKSKTTQAIKMFSELKTPIEVVIALDLPVHQVETIYREYWKLDGMFKLTQIYEEAKYDLHDLLDLHRMVKVRGIEKQDIINVLDIVKNDQLETLQSNVENLKDEVNMWEIEKTIARHRVVRLNRTINELQLSLAQKRKEMAYVDHESGKYDNTGNIHPVPNSDRY